MLNTCTSILHCLQHARENKEKETDEEKTDDNANANPVASTSSGEISHKELDGQCSFQELLTMLPEKVSEHMAENLSTPIAFACLLHLANEKVRLHYLNFPFDLAN